MRNLILPMGVDVSRGERLGPLIPQKMFDLNPSRESDYDQQLPTGSATRFNVSTGRYIDASKLSETGWGVIFGRSARVEVKQALSPLLELREFQAGDLFRTFDGADSVGFQQSARNWIQDHGSSYGPVDPSNGIPYYLMIVADPRDIPFEFQYDLDFFWACGRLWFDDDLEDGVNQAELFGRYARSIVSQEDENSPPLPRNLSIFAPTHKGDPATELFNELVAMPISHGDQKSSLGALAGYETTTMVGVAGDKKSLLDQFGKENSPPALLFTGSHGAAYSAHNADMLQNFGALITSDWSPGKQFGEEHFISSNDFDEEKIVAGMIHYCFACFGAGVPEEDNFAKYTDEPPINSPHAMLSRLPQRLLTHPGGSALAFIGHVDRAWSYSFSNDRGDAQLQSILDVLLSILKGNRVGEAMDAINQIWGMHGNDMLHILDNHKRGLPVDKNEFARIAIARNDARNLIIIGDPAVKLNVEPI